MSHNSNSDIDIPLSEKVKALPGFFGIHLEEQAPYDILKSDGGIEIRCYRPQTQARVSVHGEYKEAQKEAFNLLAGYIFGDNQIKDKIPMTTPVLMEQKIEHRKEPTKDWIMSFILPQNYLISTAPTPTDKRITLHELPVHLVASISYPGINNEEKVEEYTGILKKWLKKRPWYIPMSAFQTAQFDGPLTIPFFRKNEIHIEVKHLH
ncbi:heme-binding protein [Bacteriovorax sp. PP10]|uniref:Heme-binding protein n=1 Tax=Bacteriovorax antarcticus TaxID=3088717 RepID=A0ABU5W0R5_9BACT|nr:heme-binding protein [Bacteriovorax sp. PP10]MEA9357420.1 heme-binding protein [Bacteriovorax sp. PP10]